MHDDVHGTAVVTLAAAIAGCRAAGLRLDEATVGQIGLGAAGYGIATLIHDAASSGCSGRTPARARRRWRASAASRSRRWSS
jgi:malate dehydrogenase (oxaloacetate-decarboxylating)